jgi:hypothetical protein
MGAESSILRPEKKNQILFRNPHKWRRLSLSSTVNSFPVVDEHARECEEEGEETQLQVPDHQRRLTALLHQPLVVDPRETRREAGRQNGHQTEGLVLRGRGHGGLVPGLAIKIPPKKQQKTHLKNPLNMVFLCFFVFFFNFQFFMKIIQTFPFETDFL